MTRNNKTTPNTRTWVLYILVGVLFMAGVVLASGWKALHATEERFCQTIAFVKSQSTSFEQYNDTITAKALRRTASRCTSWPVTPHSTSPTRTA